MTKEVKCVHCGMPLPVDDRGVLLHLEAAAHDLRHKRTAPEGVERAAYDKVAYGVDNLCQQAEVQATRLISCVASIRALNAWREPAAPLEAVRLATIEECAKVAENMPDDVLYTYQRGPNDSPGNQMVSVRGQKLIAQCIRALKAQPTERGMK